MSSRRSPLCRRGLHPMSGTNLYMGTCYACKKAQMKKYRVANKEKIAIAEKAYKIAHRDDSARRQREYLARKKEAGQK